MNGLEVTAGALTGLVIGLTGVGGGALMTPILLLFFGTAPATAVGTDLWFAATTKVVATRVHHQQGLIDWVVVKRLWMGSLSASLLTQLVLHAGWVDVGGSRLLKEVIAVAVLFTALSLVFQTKLHGLGRKLRTTEPIQFKKWQPTLTILAGALMGVLVTLTSVGAGALGVAMLIHLYPFRLTPSRLVATDIVHAIPLALFAGMGHLMVGHVDTRLLLNLLCGSIPAVIIGAKLSPRLPQPFLRILLVGILGVVGVRLWLSA